MTRPHSHMSNEDENMLHKKSQLIRFVRQNTTVFSLFYLLVIHFHSSNFGVPSALVVVGDEHQQLFYARRTHRE